MSVLLTRAVIVNRDLSPQQMLDATSRIQHIDKSVAISSMSASGYGIEEVLVSFFTLGDYIRDEELEREYMERGLMPDPYAQAQVNADDFAFADECPNAVIWQQADGKECFMAFDRYEDANTRYVRVDRRVRRGWAGRWWFGGVRK